jgi:hypothetical protein
MRDHMRMRMYLIIMIKSKVEEMYIMKQVIQIFTTNKPRISVKMDTLNNLMVINMKAMKLPYIIINNTQIQALIKK